MVKKSQQIDGIRRGGFLIHVDKASRNGGKMCLWLPLS